MPRSVTDPRYELFGWDYAATNPLRDDEVAWHLHWALETHGPLLGLACGTARLLCHLAAEGYDVTGLDLSETMLRLARGCVGQLPPDARGRVRLVRGDMARFDLGRRFGLVTIADNSFRSLPARKPLLSCLRAIRRHLRVNGRLLITERRFRPEAYPGGVRRFGWSEPKRNPATGDTVRRRGFVRLYKNHRRLSGEFEYEVTATGGKTRIVRCPWSAPVLTLDEYMALFRRAGFSADVYGDYALTPVSDTSDLLCFVCAPLSPSRRA